MDSLFGGLPPPSSKKKEDGKAASAGGGGGLFGNLPPPKTVKPLKRPLGAEAASSAGGGGGLFGDLPPPKTSKRPLGAGGEASPPRRPRRCCSLLASNPRATNPSHEPALPCP